eukprot:scaffold16771_cov21-Tisochrysis_lutea.AAC.1
MGHACLSMAPDALATYRCLMGVILVIRVEATVQRSAVIKDSQREGMGLEFDVNHQCQAISTINSEPGGSNHEQHSINFRRGINHQQHSINSKLDFLTINTEPGRLFLVSKPPCSAPAP